MVMVRCLSIRKGKPMTCKEQEVKSIKEFIEELMQTETDEVKEWIEGFKKTIPGWSSYASLGVTESAIENIAFCISGQISGQLRKLCYSNGQPWRELAEKGHELLREIHRKAMEMGIKTDIEKVDWILEPEMTKSI